MYENKALDSLASEPVGPLLYRYSLPAITSMVAFSLYNIIDSIFIGRGVGPLAISGLAVTFPIMNLSIGCSLLVGIGGASVCSIVLGQGDDVKARQVLGNVLILGLLIGAAFGLGMMAFLDPLLLLFGASEATLPYAREFMQVVLLGLPVTYTLFGLNHLMRATGYPRKALVTALCTVGVNLVLAPLFIFVFGWGIRGAALATLAAQVVGMIWVVRHFLDQDSTIHFQPGIFSIRPRIVSNIVAVGMSPFMINVCASAVVAVINTSLQRYGGDLAVGAYGIINRVLFVFVMVVTGLSQGMQPLIGFNYGAKQMGRVKQTLTYGLLAGCGITTSGMAAAMLMPEVIARLFTTDAQLAALATDGLRLSTLAFPLVGIQIVTGNFFQSMGMAKLSIFLSMTRQLIFLIPCLFAMPLFYGLSGIWLSLPVADILAFVTATLILVRFLKKHPAGN